MGYNEIVFVDIWPDHSDRVKVSDARQALPTINLDENDIAAFSILSLKITFARAENEASMVPVSEYANIVDIRPRVVGHAGGVTMATEQLILLS